MVRETSGSGDLKPEVTTASRSGRVVWPPLAAFRRVATILRAALLEIFDESAYDRFLSRTRSARSIASYSAFMRDREASMAKKPRCC